MPASRGSAVRFILALGAISLLADVTYEGARSINGPYLAMLGAGAAVVGIVSGAGELAGYVLRLFSGMAADRTRRYWALTIIGYTVNLLAVPMLALANHWGAAAALIVLERAGKAVRTPSRDAMLAQASHLVGRGWGFGLHEAMDQIGACAGPLLMALVLSRREDYRLAYGLLAIPAGLALVTLFVGRWLYPDPSRFEETAPEASGSGFSREFWFYVAGAGLIAAGVIDFPLVAYHFQATGLMAASVIPVFYGVAMGVEAIAALVFGRLYDRFGVAALTAGVLLLAASNPLLFLGGFRAALAGIVLWGAGLGALQSPLRAAVAHMVAKERRGWAYGVFNAVYGLLWFGGSAAAGVLYGWSRGWMAALAMLVQLGAIPLFLTARRRPA
jgi:MFS family permease